MYDYAYIELELNKKVKEILSLIKEDYYQYMSHVKKKVVDDLLQSDKVVIVNQGRSHFNDNTLAHGGRALKDGKIHFYPDVRSFQTNEEVINKCGAILLHECFHYFIQPDFMKLPTAIENEMASFYTEGLVEKESRKFYEKHKSQISFEKANYGYNIMFVNRIQSLLGASIYEDIFSESDYMKHIGEYEKYYKEVLSKKKKDIEDIQEEIKNIPSDFRERVYYKARTMILRDADILTTKQQLKEFKLTLEKSLRQQKLSEKEL